jgi:glycosyltransferase involved in cell wall biosynthesis
MTSLHSICIPTFNRSALVRQAISMALSQTNANIEVIVSDNASTDDTPDVVGSFSDPRLRYVRTETNIGPVGNFLHLLDLANGEYMSWLQDDDLITNTLSARAVECLDLHRDCSVYMTYTIGSSSKECIFHPDVYGAPLPLNWSSQEATVFPGPLFIPLSLLASTAMAPTAVFRTSEIRKPLHPATYLKENALFGERTLLASVACNANAVVDPRIGGIFYSHDEQMSHQEYFVDGGIDAKFAYTARTLDDLASGLSDDCVKIFASYLPRYSTRHLLGFLGVSQRWPKNNSLCERVRASIYDELCARSYTAKKRKQVARMYRPSIAGQFARNILPPFMLSALRKIRG